MTPLLAVSDLSVVISDKLVIKKLNLELSQGQVVGLSGKNGSGKSSLAMTLLGDPNYQVEKGSKISLDNKDILELSVDQRARAGIYVAWQNSPTIPGVSLFALCKAASEAAGRKIESLVDFKAELEQLARRVGLGAEYIGRGVNEGFSGGERKRLDLLLILLLKPKVVVLDEIDSGLDAQGRQLIVEVVEELRRGGTGVIVISHYNQLLEAIKVDAIWEMENGQLQSRI